MTQQNVFVRKFGKLAIVITITDWEDFKELEKFSECDSPDLLISSTTSKSIYSNMQPAMQLNTYDAVDITPITKGVSIGGILTGSFAWKNRDEQTDPKLKAFIDGNGIWSYRKVDGLCAVSEMITPKVNIK
jgi:hypothetical protein